MAYLIEISRIMKSILIFSIYYLFMFIGTHANATQLDFINVAVEPYQQEIKRTGKLAFKRTLNLSFKSAGYLTGLTVDEGEYFSQGQALARLDVAELIEDKNSKYAQLLQAKREVNRVRSLLQKKLSSQQQLDDALTLVETRRAAYKVAYYNLEKAQIIAPFDGIVLARHADLGELQSPGKTVLTVAATENNWIIKVALTDAEISQVRLHQPVKVNLFKLGMMDGVISKIPALANEQSNLFTIEVLLPKISSQAGIIAGQLAEVIIATKSNKMVYRVPMSALIAVDEQGLAMLAVKQAQNKPIKKEKFTIYQMDNHYLYLLAQQNSPPLQLLTQGWQQLPLMLE